MRIQGSNNVIQLPVRRELGVTPRAAQSTSPSVQFGMCPACWSALLVTIGQYLGGTAIGAGVLLAGRKLKNKLFPPKPKQANPLELQTVPGEKPCCHAKSIDKKA